MCNLCCLDHRGGGTSWTLLIPGPTACTTQSRQPVQQAETFSERSPKAHVPGRIPALGWAEVRRGHQDTVRTLWEEKVSNQANHPAQESSRAHAAFGDIDLLYKEKVANQAAHATRSRRSPPRASRHGTGPTWEEEVSNQANHSARESSQAEADCSDVDPLYEKRLLARPLTQHGTSSLGEAEAEAKAGVVAAPAVGETKGTSSHRLSDSCTRMIPAPSCSRT